MKIGIISDTHNNQKFIKKAIKYFNDEKVAFVFHAGDVSEPKTCELFQNLDSKLILSFGNCDIERDEIRLELQDKAIMCKDICEMVIENKKIVMAHKIESINQSADLVIYGHTHIPDDRKIGNIRFVNPGECSARKFGKSTIMIYDINRDEIVLKKLN